MGGSAKDRSKYLIAGEDKTTTASETAPAKKATMNEAATQK
jgi:hypothetical protein